MSSVLEQPQEFRLQGRRQIADFTEEERAALRRPTFPATDRAASLVATLCMPKELPLQHIGGKARAVEGDQGTGCPLAPGMDCPGQGFLAGATFATEGWCLAGGRLESHFQGFVHLRLAGLEFQIGHGLANLRIGAPPCGGTAFSVLMSAVAMLPPIGCSIIGVFTMNICLS